jgi:hypothetical protein
MDVARLARIESDISQLSLADQTLLMERLAQCIRKSATERQQDWEGQLAAMAADPEIQQEIRCIEADFEPASADGLTPE